jgi:tRNA nucleotidyltransferase/poly(A) polymerase
MRDELLRLFPELRKVPAGAYVVGGAVRDLLIGRTPADVDVASRDPLASAQALSPRVIRLGKADHLSAYRVVRGEHVYDFAELLDHDIDADLARRDFTVNAIAVDLSNGELLDPHEGRGDLERRVVRMIDATNFDDDPLRMLKAVRMAVTHRFAIDPATIEAIRPRAAKITAVAAERVTYEMSLIFSDAPLATRLLRETGLDVPLFGREVEPIDRDLSLAGAMTMLVADPRAFGERWRWSENFIREVITLQRLMKRHDRVALYDAGEATATQLPALIGEEVEMPDFTSKPLLTGEEIAALTGLEPGPELGQKKRALLEAQINGDVKTRGEAETFVTR